MTTVLNAFSADHVFQLSDRKLVDARTFKQLKLANKTVLFADFFSFAFTGLAQLPLDGAWVDLDGWLLRALGPAAQRLPQGPMRALRYAFEEIRQKLDLAFADPLMKPVPKRWRGVTIVGAGWLFTPEGVAPATATISNMYTRRGAKRDAPGDSFAVQVTVWDELRGQWRWQSYGQEFDATARKRILSLSRIARRQGSAGAGVEDVLVQVFQEFAARHSKTVSEELMLVSLPKPTKLGGPIRIPLGPGLGTGPAALYVPRRAAVSKLRVGYIPAMATPGVLFGPGMWSAGEPPPDALQQLGIPPLR